MTGRVVLHVGTMKSGTSYLQSALFANKDALATQGVLVPGAGWGDQLRAALNALGKERHPMGDDIAGRWEAMAGECRDWDGTSVISVELLGPAGPHARDRILGALRGLDVEVVLTVRDLNRSLVAMWQEAVQNGRSWTWPEYVAAAERGRPRPERQESDITPPSRAFWGQQNPVRLARAWTESLGPGRVHVVTLPTPGAPPQLLLERFAGAVGFDASGLVPGERTNAAIGAASAQLLRRLNAELTARGLEFPAGMRVRKHDLAKAALAARAGEEPRIGLDVEPWVRRHAGVVVDGLRSLGVLLHGDWADLEPVPVPGIDPATVPADQEVAAAADGYARVCQALTVRYGVSDAPAWPAAETPASAAAALADLVEWSLAQDTR